MRKDLLLAAVLIIVVLAMAGGMYSYVQKQTSPITVFAYNGDLAEGTEITQDKVREIQIPRSAVTSDFAMSPKDLQGFSVKQNVYNGNIVYKSQLGEAGTEVTELTNIDWSKYRKYNVPITGMDSKITKGKKVDLLFSGAGKPNEEGPGGDENVEYAKVFMQNVLVYSSSFDEVKEDGDSSKGYAVLVLTLDQIEEVKARSRVGEIALIERAETAKSYETLGYVVGNYSKKFTGFGNAETGDYVPNEDSYKSVEE